MRVCMCVCKGLYMCVYVCMCGMCVQGMCVYVCRNVRVHICIQFVCMCVTDVCLSDCLNEWLAVCCVGCVGVRMFRIVCDMNTRVWLFRDIGPGHVLHCCARSAASIVFMFACSGCLFFSASISVSTSLCSRTSDASSNNPFSMSIWFQSYWSLNGTADSWTYVWQQ